MLEKIKILIGGAIILGTIYFCISLGIESAIAITLILVAALLAYGFLLTAIERAAAKGKQPTAPEAAAPGNEEPDPADAPSEEQQL